MDNKWIEELSVGDSVIVVTGYLSRGNEIGIVEAINKATVKVNGQLYRKDNGFSRGGGEWNKSFIREATAEGLNEIALNKTRNAVRQKMSKLQVTNLTMSDCMEILAFLKKYDGTTV